MEVGAVSSIHSAMQEGADPTAGVVALSQAQATLNTQMLVEMFAVKMSTEMQEAAALALIQSAMGIGRNIDTLA